MKILYGEISSIPAVGRASVSMARRASHGQASTMSVWYSRSTQWPTRQRPRQRIINI